MAKCALCPNDITPKDLDVLQEQLNWGGNYSEYTGRVAHRDCVERATELTNTAPQQERLF